MSSKLFFSTLKMLCSLQTLDHNYPVLLCTIVKLPVTIHPLKSVFLFSFWMGTGFCSKLIFNCRHIVGAPFHGKIFQIGPIDLALKLDKGRVPPWAKNWPIFLTMKQTLIFIKFGMEWDSTKMHWHICFGGGVWTVFGCRNTILNSVIRPKLWITGW